MDVMLTPDEGLLAGIRGFAGTTLLGDGRVLIVLDPGELLRYRHPGRRRNDLSDRTLSG